MKHRHLRAALAAVCFLSAAPASPAADIPPINDSEINFRLQKFAETQMALPDSVKAADLRAQLSRSNCEVVLPPTATAPAVALPELVARLRPAVGVIGGLYKCPKCGKFHVSAAGGFFITPGGVFVTCHHVVAGAQSEVFAVMTGDGRLVTVRAILAADAAADIAILQCEGAGFSSMPLAAGEAPVGAPVEVLSHPDGHFFTLTGGIVSRYFFEGMPARKTEMLSITADFAKGSSGGPVFDAAGSVVGMVANTHSVYYEEKDGHPENLQMVFKNCVPVKSIRRLLKPAAKE